MPFILNPFTKNFDWTAAPSPSSNSFETIQVPSGTSPVASGPSDILTLTAGSGITISGNSTTDTITISSTGLINPMTTLGDIIYGGIAGAATALAANPLSSPLYLQSVNGSAPSWQPLPIGGTLTYYLNTSTNVPIEYLFEITSGSATVGATYTNNGQTFTVLRTIASQTRIFMSATGAPTASGTLTKTSGTGGATLTFSLAHQLYVQSDTPDAAKVAHAHTGVVDGQLIHAFVTPVGFPELSFIPSGEYSAHVHAAKTSGTKTVQVRAELYEADASGAAISSTPIISVGPSAILSGSEAEYNISSTLSTVYTMVDASSRILTLFFVVVTGGGSTPDTTFWSGGTADAHMGIPSPTVDATNFVPYTGAVKDVDLGTHRLKPKGTVVLSGTNVDWLLSDSFSFTLNNNDNLTFTNATEGYPIIIEVISTGAYTLGFPAGKWFGGSGQPVQTSSGIDVYTVVRINGTLYYSVLQNGT